MRIIVIALLLLAASCGKRTVTYVPGWEEKAAEHLLERGSDAQVTDATLSRNPNSLRCARLNNYFCIKNLGWRGNVGEDRAGHTAFSDPVWSARAAARDLRRKYERGLVSAILIADAYAPWTDTVGSRRLRSGERACTRPLDITDRSHCARQPHCNCPPAYAEAMVEGTQMSTSDDLRLVDANGRLSPTMNIILRNMSGHEVGFAYAQASTIREGIRREFTGR